MDNLPNPYKSPQTDSYPKANAQKAENPLSWIRDMLKAIVGSLIV